MPDPNIKAQFNKRLVGVIKHYNEVISEKNKRIKPGNGWYDKYKNPVLTAEHVPIHWTYDLNCKTNPHLMQRLGVNSVDNPAFGGLNFKH